MSNEYPRDEELKTIQDWDFFKKPVTEFLDYVRAFWKYDDMFVLRGKSILRLYLSTGGWSGNESIIVALQQNFLFWSLCWRKTTAGGHYWFTIRLDRFPTLVKGGELKWSSL